MIFLLAAALAFQTPDRPLPDLPTLMHQVEAHQRLAETVQKDYIYREATRLDMLDKNGSIKRDVTREYEIFWLNGVNVARLLRKDGKDLSPDEQKKENERIDKQVEKARARRDKADASGRETDSRGHDEVTVSRMLELGAFTNGRRQQVNGRDTILVDFTGDPKAKTHNRAEDALKVMAGTLWVDEQDKSIQHLEGRFVDNFKIGGGLVANIRKDTSFKATNIRVNEEVWLPQTLDAHGQARFLLFVNLDGNLHIQTTDYRKFKASATILPTLNQVEDPAAAPAAPTPPPPQ